MHENKKLGFGIIGCGLIANWHQIGVEESGQGYTVGAFDIKPEYSENFCKKYNIKQFIEIEDMLSDDNIDIVCVCTPSGLHAKYTLLAAEAGKHVLVEKPMALNVEDCDAIIEASVKYNVKIGVVSQFRLRKAMGILKSVVADNRLGKIVTGDLYMKYFRSQEYYNQSKWRGTWELDGGGALMNQGIHGVDTLLYIMGPVKTVYGMARTLIRNIEVEDTASAVVEYVNGALGVIQGTTSVYPGYPRRISISGTKGTIDVTEDTFTEWNIENEEVPADIKLGGAILSSSREPKDIDHAGHNMQVKDIIDAVLENRLPSVDCREGRKAVELITAIYKSSQTNQPINLN
ncbi:MAG: Gfo/Idh/MocA family oxidoreductase [Oscillospiraceae bacterium]|nr:Gfo/Idh/MocA family oxidoreductase [Oscillospiraceae bacterium]